MMSQWLQEQEAKLQQMSQLQQEQDKHLGQTLIQCLWMHNLFLWCTSGVEK